MAAIEVKEIPTNNKKIYNKHETVMEDVLHAIENKIEKFEFIGEYNYNHLDTFARETINHEFTEQRIIRPLIYECRKKIDLNDPIIEEEFNGKRHDIEYAGNRRKYLLPSVTKHICITSVKKEDRKHVYCEINYDALEKLKQEVKNYLKPNPEYVPIKMRDTKKKWNKEIMNAVLNMPPETYDNNENIARYVARLFAGLTDQQRKFAIAFAIHLNEIDNIDK